MTNSYLLGIDIGTQSTKVAIFDMDGNVVRENQQEYNLLNPEPGWAEQDPLDWWKATSEEVENTMNELENRGEIIGVGVCGQMHAPVPIDNEGNLLYRSPLLWCDKRNRKETRKVREEFDEEELMKITGNPITPAWTAMKLIWMRENTPRVYNEAYKFLMPKDYISFKLTGETFTDYSDASGTFLLDIRNEEWSEEIADRLDIDLDQFPEIVPSTKVIGRVTKRASEATGLPMETPVVAGGADFMCTLLAGGVVSEGRAADISGTASEVAFYTPDPVIDKNIMNVRHVTEAGWVPFGIQEGGLLKWFRDQFGYKEIEAAEERGISPYEVMIEEASKVDIGSDGLILTPFFLGQRPHYPNARGNIYGLTLAHGRPHVIRAIMEGIAYSMREVVDIVEDSGMEVNAFRSLGGGAKNYLWRNIKADIYGKPILTLSSYKGGALGAAILAGVGVGIFDSPSSAADRIASVKDKEEPNMNNHDKYQKFYEKYKKVNDYVNKLS